MTATLKTTADGYLVIVKTDRTIEYPFTDRRAAEDFIADLTAWHGRIA
jgi:hypothetical protein